MIPEKAVWIFHGTTGRMASGVFSTQEKARAWIREHRLSGTLSAYPLDEGVFDWACRNDVTNLKPEKLAARLNDSSFIAAFTTASQDHFHFENGEE